MKPASTFTVGSLFSGVGGFDLGFHAAGFETAWFVEIDRDCVSVLERHWPDVPRWGDVSTVDPADLAPVDVVIFGSPCQDLSVAGKRAGMDGERSGLFGEAIRIIRGLRPTPAFCVWENVPGALSSARGRDFGAVLDALADCGALDIAWRVLDARHFGVPQRRRRIFLVADFGAERAGQVLFESASGNGDSAARGEAGEGAAGDVEDGAGVVGFSESGPGWWRDGVGAIRAEGENRPSRPSTLVMPPVAAFGGNRTSGALDVATACNAHGGPHGRQDFESETFIVANSVTSSAGHHGHSSPRGDGSDNQVVRPVAFDWQKGGGGNDHSWRGKSREWIERAGDYAGSLSASKHDAVAFHLTQDPINGAESPALGAGNGAGCSTIAVAISENQRAEVRETPYARQITSGGGKPGQGYPSVREGMAVRRLTPRECERLQGWPDDHSRWRADGREIPDGPRYRMIGNGVAAPVAAWIAARMRVVLETDP